MIEDLIYALKTKFGFGLKSRNWKHWFALLDLKTCEDCRKMHGKIYGQMTDCFLLHMIITKHLWK